jgi:hypothetical protein
MRRGLPNQTPVIMMSAVHLSLFLSRQLISLELLPMSLQSRPPDFKLRVFCKEARKALPVFVMQIDKKERRDEPITKQPEFI